MTPPPPLLVFDAVVAGYTKGIVGPVSFSVLPGETVGLTGPNGSGKTTLANTILGTARVFKGSVRRAEGLEVSVQRQHPVRLSEMPLTGRELLHLAGADQQPVPASIGPFIEQRLDRLSGGQFQLLQVWAYLGATTGLVVLDEPTSNMDADSKRSLEEIMRAAHERVGGVLVISHDHEFLEHVMARIVSIDQ